MAKYREILRLKSLGFSDRNIAHSVTCSRNTIPRVLEKAKELGLNWPLSDEMTDGAIEKLLYPKEKPIATTNRMMPDCVYIRK
ncbi:MAG: hypothetical protein PHZ09_00810 [Eubacteriales bacterium]|jgi:transposase|nr:hypothetical protein [Eubacteriales bacterium]